MSDLKGRGMSKYEIFLTEISTNETLVLNGGGLLNFVRILEYFQNLAQTDLIPGVQEISLYDDFHLPGNTLSAILQELGFNDVSINQGADYVCVLSEI